MAETNSGSRVSITNLILIPSVITLAVTILRLVGELNNWSDFWFSREAGGGLSPIGISWLVPILGIYFAMKLARSGDGPASAGRAIGFAFLGLVVFAAIFALGVAIFKTGPALLGGMAVASVAAILVVRNAWPAMFKTLLAYGFAARIPVAIVMLIAIRGDWKTHYDVPPPPPGSFPAMHWFMKWVLIGAVPQMFLWIAFTVTVGLLFGGIAIALFHRGRQKTGEPAHA